MDWSQCHWKILPVIPNDSASDYGFEISCQKLLHTISIIQNKDQKPNIMLMRWNRYMMTSSNGNIFRVTGPLYGEFTGPGEFPTQRPVTRSFDVFFDLRLNKRLSRQPWGWWLETPLWSLWRRCNDLMDFQIVNVDSPILHTMRITSKYEMVWWEVEKLLLSKIFPLMIHNISTFINMSMEDNVRPQSGIKMEKRLCWPPWCQLGNGCYSPHPKDVVSKCRIHVQFIVSAKIKSSSTSMQLP